MTLALSPAVSKKVRLASKAFGINEKDLFQNALVFYLEAMRPYLDLKREVDGWENLSDEALLNFERSL